MQKEINTQKALGVDSAYVETGDTTADILGQDDGGISEASEKQQGQQEKHTEVQGQSEQSDMVAAAQELAPLLAPNLSNPRIEKIPV